MEQTPNNKMNLKTLEAVSGFRYVPRADSKSPGRIKDYQIFVGNDLVKK